MAMLSESFEKAKEEMKRADHLMFVSLKYTRTVDVLKSIIERLINAFDFTTDSLFEKLKQQKKITEIPTIPKVRVDVLKQLFDHDEQMKTFLRLYLLLRKIHKAEFARAREYRRHVTMTAYLEDAEIEITIDIIFDYFERTKEFLEYIQAMLEK
ncbi:hypothetical protein J4457_00395 [Candidatus Woesearchaeota archaeon]|nr:hypothetical protein [Candidatus Woesearchaeota archaeon]